MGEESDESGIRIIWLDTHIGVLGDYQAFKEKFRQSLQPITGVPGKSIHNLILCLERDIAPIEYVSTVEDAFDLIRLEKEKRFILISSFLLGQHIVPDLVKEYHQAYSFYFFCLDVAGAGMWGMKYAKCLQIFDHENDLLLRLVHDIAKEFIGIGHSYLSLDDGEMARRYFVTAETLELSANSVDTLNPPRIESLRKLQGSNGLIARSQAMKDRQKAGEIIKDNQERIPNVELNAKQFILLNLDLTTQQIVHFLQIFLPEETLLTVDDPASSDIFPNVEKQTCIFARNRTAAEQFRERNFLPEASIYALEDDDRSFRNIESLVDKLVELIIEDYQHTAKRHLDTGKMQLADIGSRIADRIRYENDRMKNW